MNTGDHEGLQLEQPLLHLASRLGRRYLFNEWNHLEEEEGTEI